DVDADGGGWRLAVDPEPGGPVARATDARSIGAGRASAAAGRAVRFRFIARAGGDQLAGRGIAGRRGAARGARGASGLYWTGGRHDTIPQWRPADSLRQSWESHIDGVRRGQRAGRGASAVGGVAR